MRGIFKLFVAVVGVGSLAGTALANGKYGPTHSRPAPRVIAHPRVVVTPKVVLDPRVILHKTPLVRVPVTVGPKTLVVPTIASPRVVTGPRMDLRFGDWTRGRWFGHDSERVWDARLGCFLYRLAGRGGLYRYAEERGCFTPVGMPEGLPPGPVGCPTTTPPMDLPPMDAPPMDAPPMDTPIDEAPPMDDAPMGDPTPADPMTPATPDDEPIAPGDK